jgi:hypothetical protein
MNRPTKIAREASGHLWQQDRFRFQHTYIIGKTRKGKTNLLRGLIFQTIAKGEGMIVMSPQHQIFEEELLPFINEHRWQDVIYFDPAAENPIPYNPFYVPPGKEISSRAEEVCRVFDQALGGLGGTTMEEIFQSATYALLRRTGSTIIDLRRLLLYDHALIGELASTATDEFEREFWADHYLTLTSSARRLLVRLNPMFRKPTLMRLLSHPNNTLDISQAMREGKIIFINLSQGELGYETSALIGQLITGEIFNAIFVDRERAIRRQGRGANNPFSLFFDEFQTFVDNVRVSYEYLLSQSGKYNVGIFLANQWLSQLPHEVQAAILGSCGTLVSFLIEPSDAQTMAKAMHVPHSSLMTEGEIGQAWVRIDALGQTFRIQTDKMPDPDEGSRRLVEEIRKNTARIYGIGGALDAKHEYRAFVESQNGAQEPEDAGNSVKAQPRRAGGTPRQQPSRPQENDADEADEDFLY